MVTILRMLSRPGSVGLAPVALPVVAFAVVTAISLIVIGGAMMFFRGPVEDGLDYGMFAGVALALLAVPLATLGVASARLSARRRDDRLATLRLLGASMRTVTAIAVAEAALVALFGALLGVVLYAGLLPLVGTLRFFGATIGPAALWVGAPALALTVAGVLLVAAAASLAGLSAVRVTPLGVRTRERAPRLAWWGLALGIAVLLGAVLLMNLVGGLADAFGAIAFVLVILAVLTGGMLALNLIGAPVVGILGRVMAARATTPARLIAGRRLAEAPGVAWRSVSGLAMISFVAVVGGSGLSLLDLGASGGVDPVQAVFLGDLRTGVLVTLVIAFVMLACTVGVSQAAAILDERRMIVALDRTGMPRRVLEQAQRTQVWAPLLLSALGGVTAGVLLMLPLIGVTLLLAPLSILTIAACFGAGFGAVWLAMLGTRPIVSAVLAEPHRS